MTEYLPPLPNGYRLDTPTSFTPPSDHDVADYIRDAASKRGIDPRIALSVAESEGGLSGKPGDYIGSTPTSFGQYQLHYGSGGRGFSQRGLGNDFTKATGLDASDPKTWKAQVDFALDHARDHGWGEWYGARKIGITGFQGIDRNVTSRAPNVTDRAPNVTVAREVMPRGVGRPQVADAGLTQFAQADTGIMSDAAPPAINVPPLPKGYQLDQPEKTDNQGSRPDNPVRARDLFLREMIGQGTMAGFGDEAEAAARATADYWGGKAKGQSWEQLYDKYLTNARKMLGRFEKSAESGPEKGLPEEAQLVGAIGGLALPGPDVLDAIGLGSRALGVAGRAAAAAGKGALYGGAYGFGTGEGAGDRLRRAAIQGAVGTATGGVASPVADLAVAGASKALAQPVAAALRPESVAAARLGAALSKDAGQGLTDAEFAAAKAAGQPVTNMDRGGEATRALVRSASNTSPEARQTLEDVIDPRFETQGDRLTDFLEKTVNGKDSLAMREELQAAARKANRPAYAAAYREGDRGLWSPELERLSGSPDVLSAMKAAAQTGKSRAINEGFGAFNPGVKITDDGRVSFGGKKGVPTYPNLQYWDYVKRELDDAANAARRAGRNEEASRLAGQATLLRNELDKLVPSYAKARSTASSFFGADDALTAGENFVGRKGTFGEAAKAWQGFSNPEKHLFKIGFVSKLMDTIAKSPDRSDLVRKIFGNEDARNRIRLALGAKGAKEFEAFMGVEAVMDKARKALGNSTTARQLAEIGAAGGVGGGLYGLATGDWSPRDLSVAALLSAGGKKAGVKINERVVNQVAKMLASDDPDVYQVAIAKMTKSPSLMKLLRAAVTVPTAGAVQETRP